MITGTDLFWLTVTFVGAFLFLVIVTRKGRRGEGGRNTYKL